MDILLLLISIIALHYNKPAISFTGMIGLFTSYYQMGSNLSTFIVLHNVSDTGMLLFFYILLYGHWQNKRYSYPILSYLYWPLFIFGVFLTVVVLYDYTRGVSVLSIIQCFRHWLLLFLAIPLLKYYDVEVYEKTIRYILYVSLFATILILLDHYVGTHILQEEAGLFISKSGVKYQRAAIPTTYCIFYLFLMLTDYYKYIKLKWRYLFVGLFFISIAASMIRSQLVSVLAGIVIILYITEKIKLSNLGSILIGATLFMGVILSEQGLRERIFLGWKEVNSLSSSSTTKEKGNMSFRLDMLKERYEYVTERWDRFLLGIGSVREKQFPTTFKIGLYDAKMGRAVQLDTADIAWPLFVLRLGILGTFLILCFWIKLLILFRSSLSLFGKTSWTFLVISFPVSFCGSSIANGSFWLFMIILLIVSFHSELDKSKKNICS